MDDFIASETEDEEDGGGVADASDDGGEGRYDNVYNGND